MNQDLYNAVVEYRQRMYEKAVSILNEGKRVNPIFYILTVTDKIIDVGLVDGMTILYRFGDFNMEAVTYVHGLCYDMMNKGKEIVGVGFIAQNTIVYGYNQIVTMGSYNAVISILCLKEGVEHDIFQIEKNENGHYLKDWIDDDIMMRDTFGSNDPLRKLFPHNYQKGIRLFIVDYSVYARDYMPPGINIDFNDQIQEWHREIEAKRAQGYKTVLMKFPDHDKSVERVRMDLYDKKISFATMPVDRVEFYERLIDQCEKVWDWDVDRKWKIEGMISEFHQYLAAEE